MHIDDAIHDTDIEIVDLSAAGPIAAIHLLPAVLVPAFRRQLEFRSSQQVGSEVAEDRLEGVGCADTYTFDDGFEEGVEALAFVAGGDKVMERSCGEGMLMSWLERGRVEAVDVENRRVEKVVRRERVLMESIVGRM